MDQSCAWCGEAATQSLELVKGRRLKHGYVPPRTAPVCDQHYEQLTGDAPLTDSERQRETYGF